MGAFVACVMVSRMVITGNATTEVGQKASLKMLGRIFSKAEARPVKINDEAAATDINRGIAVFAILDEHGDIRLATAVLYRC